MIERIQLFESSSTDPYTNLAAEKVLLDKVKPGCCILYLWQNENTVVIGRNQNPWKECRISALEADGGKLARRLSGGGAVFHDLGNLNFTFLMCEEDYHISRQLQVILLACRSLGIPAEPSGRNDLLVNGKKFSGNAFYHQGGKAYHHGTLLISADTQKLQKYLSPPKAKLEAKGVSSVRSRVVNLSSLHSGLTCERMKDRMKDAFSKVYALAPEELQLSEEDADAVELLRQQYSAWEYLYGKPLPFSSQWESHFPWGNISLELDAKGGRIQGVKAYTDALDWTLPEKLENALLGCCFTRDAVQNAILSVSDIPMDIRMDISTGMISDML